MLSGKKIVVGVSGGIAAYKAAEFISSLQKEGALLTVIMTKHAQEFITPLTLGTLARGEVLSELFAERPGSVQHIAIAQQAELIIIIPATANIIAKYAHGIADDLLSTILLAATSPVLIAPAMNVHMYEHPATQANIALLKMRGVNFIEPTSGLLACGEIGKGRLAEVKEIISTVHAFFSLKNDLAGKSVLVTAGGTNEAIDPVRHLANKSSGKMGYAIAKAARDRGAEVTLISGPTNLDKPTGVNFVQVTTAQEMYNAALSVFSKIDITIKAAAVADYRPEKVFQHKIKKKEDELIIHLIKNPDILKEMGKLKHQHQVLVGFAAETDQVEEYAKKKLIEKNLDFIVANNISLPGVGFGSETNTVTFYFKNGKSLILDEMPKYQVANKILDEVVEIQNNFKRSDEL